MRQLMTLDETSLRIRNDAVDGDVLDLVVEVLPILQYKVAISIFHSHLSKMNFHYELPFSCLISSIDSSVNRRDIIILSF